MNTSQKTLESVLDTISPILLGEMDSVKLMNRIDTKYLTKVDTLVHVLEDAARHGYRALETEGTKVCPYDTLYYDTPGLQMFLDHHNRRLVRQKVRTRTYVDSGQTFLEIKRKNNHGRTKKKRTQIPPADFRDFSAEPGPAPAGKGIRRDVSLLAPAGPLPLRDRDLCGLPDVAAAGTHRRM